MSGKQKNKIKRKKHKRHHSPNRKRYRNSRSGVTVSSLKKGKNKKTKTSVSKVKRRGSYRKIKPKKKSISKEKISMNLFIIGNGFDISHGIPCKYSDFYNYLSDNRDDILETMGKFYYVGNDSELWSDFEMSLEKDIDYGSLSEIISENVPNLGSDDFRDRDWYDAQIYIEKKCDELLEDIRSGFEEWIESLENSRIRKRYRLDRSAKYITFNYTDVLEQVYKIISSNILHIHNKVGEVLVFGHGKKSEEFNVREALYGDENAYLSTDEDGNIESSEVGHEKFAENAVCAFYDKMRKNTEEIIQNHSDFFRGLSDTDEITVLGHSYNDIDLPYFRKIAKSVGKKTKWTLYYYSDNDKINAKKTMTDIGITENLQEYKHCSELEVKDTQLKLF